MAKAVKSDSVLPDDGMLVFARAFLHVIVARALLHMIVSSLLQYHC